MLRCIRDNLAEIRNDINHKYAADIETKQQNMINYYVKKYSANHAPGSSLNEDAKKAIAKLVRGMVVKDEKH